MASVCAPGPGSKEVSINFIMAQTWLCASSRMLGEHELYLSFRYVRRSLSLLKIAFKSVSLELNLGFVLTT